jgi:hypothetical protein
LKPLRLKDLGLTPAIHGFLDTFDYHRVHAPVRGKVIESKVVSGLHYARIEAVEVIGDLELHADVESPTGNERHLALNGIPVENHCSPQRTEEVSSVSNSNSCAGKRYLPKKRKLDATNEFRYQFNQARGVVIIETKMGLVAVVLVGMAVVSSISLEIGEGQLIEKGDELGHFQFGGSDVILLAQNDVSINAVIGEHCLVGSSFGSFGLT